MIKLGNTTFVVPAPGGMKSFSLQQRVLPVAGRIVNVFLHLVAGSSAKDLGTLLESDVLSALPQAMPYIGEIFGQMPVGELEAITKALLEGATFDGKPLFLSNGEAPFDLVMQGRTIDTWKLLWHAIEVWYPDFFVKGRSLFVTAGKAKNSVESTTSEVSGPAGA